VRISGGEEEEGGAIFSEGPLDIRHCTIEFNTATAYGGAIYIAETCELTVRENSVITNNSATGSGGGIYLALGRFPLVVTDSEISFNHAGLIGGGIFATFSNLASLVPDDYAKFTRAKIQANEAKDPLFFNAGQGGGVFLGLADVEQKQRTRSIRSLHYLWE